MKTLLWLLILGFTSMGFFVGDCQAQSPGDTIGWTGYRDRAQVTVDLLGGVHFAWTGGLFPGVRNIKYNCFTPGSPSPWPGQGETISIRNGAGYPQLTAFPDGRAVCSLHQAPLNAESIFVAIDQYQCLGAFRVYRVPNRMPISNRLLWPYLSIDSNNRMQLVATATITGMPYTYMPVGYTRSDNEGVTWSTLTPVDTIRSGRAMVVSSPVSNKVAIVYCHQAGTSDTIGNKNDVYFIQSVDGITWNWANGKINVTNYSPQVSLYANGDIDAVYDYNDNLHLIWIARWVTTFGESDRVFIYNFDTASQTITAVTHIDMPQINRCIFNPLEMSLNNVSIGADSLEGLLYTSYCRYDTMDCSADSLANGEIYIQQSADNGATWTAPLDLTNTHTPNCLDRNCSSDICPSMAEKVNAFVHIFYQSFRGESSGFEIYSPMLYLHPESGPVNLGEQKPLPSGFLLSQNYPNPFNAQTTISYAVAEKCQVILSVYNIMGQKAVSLVNGLEQSGEHKIIWDARNIPSGVYYARLEAGEGSRTIKMILLK